MIYICTHKEPAYTLDCPHKIIYNNEVNLPDEWRHLRGMLQILKGPIPDEVGIFQQRRRLNETTIPEGYRIVCPNDFGSFNVYNQYASYHNAQDLDIASNIINDMYFTNWIRKNNNDELYMHNIFIMNKEDYISYCNFLFSVLNEYRNKVGDRNICFLAERLGAYWISANIPKNERYITKTITYNK